MARSLGAWKARGGWILAVAACVVGLGGPACDIPYPTDCNPNESCCGPNCCVEASDCCASDADCGEVDLFVCQARYCNPRGPRCDAASSALAREAALRRPVGLVDPACASVSFRGPRVATGAAAW